MVSNPSLRQDGNPFLSGFKPLNQSGAPNNGGNQNVEGSEQGNQAQTSGKQSGKRGVQGFADPAKFGAMNAELDAEINAMLEQLGLKSTGNRQEDIEAIDEALQSMGEDESGLELNSGTPGAFPGAAIPAGGQGPAGVQNGSGGQGTRAMSDTFGTGGGQQGFFAQNALFTNGGQNGGGQNTLKPRVNFLV